MADDNAALAALLVSCLDFTELSDDCSMADVDQLIDRANTPIGHVAALCVWPNFVAHCRERLAGTGIRIATVVNFPDGSRDYQQALEDTRQAVDNGADEIDMVISRSAIPLEPEFVTEQLVAFVEAAAGKRVKAILETGEMKSADDVAVASKAAIAGGAGFIKTSTGKTSHGASLDAARIMLETIRASGKPVGLKPSGGIRTLEDGRAYVDLAAEIMGQDWVKPENFRIGASSIMTDLMKQAGFEDSAHKTSGTY